MKWSLSAHSNQSGRPFQCESGHPAGPGGHGFHSEIDTDDALHLGPGGDGFHSEIDGDDALNHLMSQHPVTIGPEVVPPGPPAFKKHQSGHQQNGQAERGHPERHTQQPIKGQFARTTRQQ